MRTEAQIRRIVAILSSADSEVAYKEDLNVDRYSAKKGCLFAPFPPQSLILLARLVPLSSSPETFFLGSWGAACLRVGRHLHIPWNLTMPASASLGSQPRPQGSKLIPWQPGAPCTDDTPINMTEFVWLQAISFHMRSNNRSNVSFQGNL